MSSHVEGTSNRSNNMSSMSDIVVWYLGICIRIFPAYFQMKHLEFPIFLSLKEVS